MDIVELEFHDSCCSAVGLSVDGSLVVRLPELRVEVARDGERQAWQYPAQLVLDAVRRVELSGALPADGEIISAAFDAPPPPPPTYFRWLLNGGAAVERCILVFASGAQLTVECAHARVEVLGEGSFIQTYD
jgi:hypothetical protein